MKPTHSFRFANAKLNECFIARLKKAGIVYAIDRDGVVHYSQHDEEVVENELICSIRNEVFSSWHVLSCPKDWTERYEQHMKRHHVPFSQELINDHVCYLIPRKYRPHSWKLEGKIAGRKHPIAD